MKVFIIRDRSGIRAEAEYCVETKECTVLKGSTVSIDVCHEGKFRGGKTIERERDDAVKNNVVIKDKVFKSASTAANFVTGHSTNGLTAWKDINGKTIKQLLKEAENE